MGQQFDSSLDGDDSSLMVFLSVCTASAAYPVWAWVLDMKNGLILDLLRLNGLLADRVIALGKQPADDQEGYP